MSSSLILLPDHSQIFGRQSNPKSARSAVFFSGQRQRTVRSAALFLLNSVTVNTVVHTESESCQKQCVPALVCPSVSFIITQLPTMGLNFHEDIEEVSLYPNPEELNNSSQYVSIRGGTGKGFLPLPYTVGAKRHQSFRVCKNGDGSRVQQRVLKGQAGGSKFGYPRSLPQSLL